jgi:hypothetical protein
MAVRERPLLTDIYQSIEEFIPEPESVYIFGYLGEERGIHSQEWENQAQNVQFVRIVEQTPTSFKIRIGEEIRTVLLRSRGQLQRLYNDIGPKRVYLDFTGLSHQVWAPLLRTALSIRQDVKAVYIEPIDYRFSPTPTEGEIFDLSEQISGISPIPGFASLTDKGDDNVCFVPLLGFEGIRLKYIIEQVQPPKIVPIIGLPGFRHDFPFYTYHGNRLALLENDAWKNVHYAIANCPFSLFNTLEDIAAKYPQDFLKIAPIGTKPHALGAVLYTIASPQPVELIYDHPIRKSGRTKGAARLLVYHVSALSLPITQSESFR